MRHIDLDDLEFPEGWLEKAQKLTEELKACATAAERKVILDKTSSQRIWKELKENLAKLSNDKCWYSEAKDIMSDRDVDHFRPKGRVVDKDGTIYDGYWWLAFDWKNYRFSSQYSNQGRKGKDNILRGKRDYFPLKTGSYRATTPTDDCSMEEPYLLDPVVLRDTLLITFDDKGFAVPNPLYDDNSWENDRAEESIELYHLNYHRIVGSREMLWKQVQNLVHQINDLIISPTRSPMINKEIENKMRELKNLAKDSAELSSTAIASLKSCEAKWARALA